jgi:3',5'-cyclic AMP phosphodiesterase CpdA
VGETTTLTEIQTMLQARTWSPAQRDHLQKLINQNQKLRGKDDERYTRNLGLLQEFLQDDQGADLTFDVLSDVHTNGQDLEKPENRRFVTALQDIQYLDPLADAFVVPGDFTDHGGEFAYRDFFQSLQEYHMARPIVALGNHDVRWQKTETAFKQQYWRYNGQYMDGAASAQRLYWDTFVRGYHFIIMNTEKDLKDNVYFSREQLAWVQTQLAAHQDPQRPTLLIIHQTFTGTADHIALDRIYNPAQDPDPHFNAEMALKDILRQYPRTVIFTGHVHNGRDMIKVYPEAYGYVVDCPSFVRADYGQPGHGDAYQVRVQGNTVTLRLRSYCDNHWLPQNQRVFTV